MSIFIDAGRWGKSFLKLLTKPFQRNWVFVKNSEFLILVSLQPSGVDLRSGCKDRDQTICNIIYKNYEKLKIQNSFSNPFCLHNIQHLDTLEYIVYKAENCTTPCTSWTRHTKRSMNTFYFSGSICRKQFLTDQNLAILNCAYYWSFIQNNTPHKFVRSINNTCHNSFYSMYCMDVANTELNSYFQFQLKHSDFR